MICTFWLWDTDGWTTTSKWNTNYIVYSPIYIYPQNDDEKLEFEYESADEWIHFSGWNNTWGESFPAQVSLNSSFHSKYGHGQSKTQSKLPAYKTTMKLRMHVKILWITTPFISIIKLWLLWCVIKCMHVPTMKEKFAIVAFRPAGKTSSIYVQNLEQHEEFGRDKWARSSTLNGNEIRLNVAACR